MLREDDAAVSSGVQTGGMRASDQDRDINPSRVHRPLSTPRRPWPGIIGDAVAAATVLIGGGLLGGTLFPGPDFLAPPDAMPLFGRGTDAGMPATPPGGPSGAGGSLLATVLLVLVPAALMPLRRRWPVPVFALALATFIIAVVLDQPSLGPGIATTIAAYAFAYRTPRRLALSVMAAAAGAVVVLAFAHTGWDSLDSRVFQIGAALAIAAALGDSARSRQELLTHAEDRALRAEQTREVEARRRVSDERLRIARDLHDTVAHQISVINLQAGAAAGYVTAHPDRAQDALSAIRQASRGVLDEIGGLLRYLREDTEIVDALPRVGVDALAPLLAQMQDAGLTVECDTTGDLTRVAGLTGTTVYRVIQEGLTNAHKHGTGDTAHLMIDVRTQSVEIEIRNPAVQSPQRDTDARTGTGLGMVGIRERVAALQGTVTTTHADGRYRLHVAVPLTPAQTGRS